MALKNLARKDVRQTRLVFVKKRILSVRASIIITEMLWLNEMSLETTELFRVLQRLILVLLTLCMELSRSEIKSCHMELKSVIMRC